MENYRTLKVKYVVKDHYIKLEAMVLDPYGRMLRHEVFWFHDKVPACEMHLHICECNRILHEVYDKWMKEALL